MEKLLSLSIKNKGRFSGLFHYIIVPLATFVSLISSVCFDNDTTCGNTEQAKALSLLIANDQLQQRQVLICNTTLVALAEKKAKDMAERGLVSHFLGGSPNTRIRDAGLHLPEYYGDAMSNQVEALAGGYITADDVWYALKTSTSHRQHLLAELLFYQEQDQIGIGFYKDYSTPHVEYWAIYLTKLADKPEHHYAKTQSKAATLLSERKQKFKDVPDKGLGIVTESGEIILQTKKPDQ